MATVSDQYAVLPGPSRLRRPGALLRSVLRHPFQDIAGNPTSSSRSGRQPGLPHSPQTDTGGGFVNGNYSSSSSSSSSSNNSPFNFSYIYSDKYASDSAEATRGDFPTTSTGATLGNNNISATPRAASHTTGELWYSAATAFLNTAPTGAASGTVPGPATGTATAASACTALTTGPATAHRSITASLSGAPILPPAESGPPNLKLNRNPLLARHARSSSSPLTTTTPPPPLLPPLPAPPTASSPHEKRRLPHRLSLPTATMPEYRHIRSSSLSISNGAHSASASTQGMPRSPPNTAHVPCKFFRQGACQAGNACPFSHDLGAAAETICKYFAKGNCKFGPKCANIHILPDGRRINYGKNGVTIGVTPIALAGRTASSSGSTTSAPSNHPYNQSTTSALTSSLYGADQSAFPYMGDERQHHLHHQPSLENGLPTIDTPYSYPNSNYGSPRDEDPTRLGFGLSPANGGKGLSVLDAPLPASFDSNGISNAARFPAAPWPSSVPSKFTLESPSPSLSSVKDSRATDTLKLLHNSAFGSSEHLATPTPGSPPSSHNIAGDEYFGKRTMHSARFSKPRMMSSSVPKTTSVDRDWEAEFAFVDDSADDNLPENYVPENLQDLLTPQEKARRGSMRAEQPDFSIDGITKYGSPIGTSPSRWGPLFQRQKEEEELARSARNAAASAFGHVGSPLRNSTLAQEMGGASHTVSGSLSRPSAIRSGTEPMSVLSQQLQRTRLDDGFGGPSPLLHPSRATSGGIAPIGKDRIMERHVSSGSISSSVTGRFTTPIDEEDPAFVFSMEEEDDTTVAKMRKRASAGMAVGGFPSYAGAVAGKGVTNGSKEGRDAVSVNGR